jgi:hypothetical protein
MLKIILDKRDLNMWTEFSFIKIEFLDQLNNYKLSKEDSVYGLSYRLSRISRDKAITE